MVWRWKPTLSIVSITGPISTNSSGRWWNVGRQSGRIMPQICCEWPKKYTELHRLIQTYSSSMRVPQGGLYLGTHSPFSALWGASVHVIQYLCGTTRCGGRVSGRFDATRRGRGNPLFLIWRQIASDSYTSHVPISMRNFNVKNLWIWLWRWLSEITIKRWKLYIRSCKSKTYNRWT